MKKFILILCLLCLTMAAKAQFEQGKWIVNPSLTGLNLSDSEISGKNIGVGGQVGAFLLDNAALMVGVGAQWTDPIDVYYTNVGARYYFSTTGVYLGAGLKLNKWKSYGSSFTNYSSYAELGYAFFITRTITIEPVVFYDLSFKNSDYSELGFKVGFGIYF